MKAVVGRSYAIRPSSSPVLLSWLGNLQEVVTLPLSDLAQHVGTSIGRQEGIGAVYDALLGDTEIAALHLNAASGASEQPDLALAEQWGIFSAHKWGVLHAR